MWYVCLLAHTAPPFIFPQVVEELEDRFGDKMDDMLNTIKASLLEAAAPAVNGDEHQQTMQVDNVVYSEYQEDYQGDNHWDYDANEVVFDDAGEGAGIEGDLDVEDD